MHAVLSACLLLRENWNAGTILRVFFFPSFLSVVVVLGRRGEGDGGKGGSKAASPCWCAALWCHFLCLWVKRGGSRPEGRRPRTVGFPWQLEDIQLLRILLLNSIQIFGIQVFFPFFPPPLFSFSLGTAAASSLNGQEPCVVFESVCFLRVFFI